MTTRGKKWLRAIGIVVAVALGLWLAKDRILMKLSWRDLYEDSTAVDDIRRDLSEGRTGPQPLKFPCVTHLDHVDLDLTIKGPIPNSDNGNVVMEVYLDRRIYLGPPTRRIKVAGFPVCRKSFAPANLSDTGLWDNVGIDFTDLRRSRWMGFSGEQAFPLAFWRTVEIELLPIPTRVTDGVITQIIVRPTDPAAPYPDTLRNLR